MSRRPRRASPLHAERRPRERGDGPGRRGELPGRDRPARPPPTAAQLLAIYGFARLVDDVGDEAAGDRGALLDWVEAELDRRSTDDAMPEHPAMRALQPTVRALRASGRAVPPADRGQPAGPDRHPLRRRSTSCSATAELSAAPVGELVLHVFGAATPERIALSDQVCAGLQVTEHLQDVAEDYARGRVYLPREDLARFGCTEADLATPALTPEQRELIAFEVQRARGRCWRRARRWPGRCRAAPALASPGSSPEAARRSTRSRPPATTCWRATPPPDPRRLRARAPGSAGRTMTIPALEIEHAYRALRADHPRRGRELLLRDPAAAAVQAPGDERRVRVRAPGRRHRRRRASTSRRKLAALAVRAARCWRDLLGRRPRDAPSDPVAVGARRTRTATTTCRSTRSSMLIDGVELGRARDARTRRSTSWSSTAGTSPARSGGCAWRSSATADEPRRGRGAGRRPRRGDAADEHPPRRSRGPRARARVPAGRGSAPVRLRGPVRRACRQDAAALIRFEAARAARVVRPRAGAGRAARPPQRRRACWR